VNKILKQTLAMHSSYMVKYIISPIKSLDKEAQYLTFY